MVLFATALLVRVFSHLACKDAYKRMSLVMLELLVSAIKLGTVQQPSAPSASCYLADNYASDWRGLELPLHLALPDAAWLAGWLITYGMVGHQAASTDSVMTAE